MLQIHHHLFPDTLEKAYTTLMAEPTSQILGGCGYIRLGDRTIITAIDLTRCGLDYIRDTETGIEIGAMTTLRTLETSPYCRTLFGGALPRSVAHIVGVQLRNLVTIGGTVAGRFAFSDPLTALLALDARLTFYHHGEIPLEDFLAGANLRDILVRITIPKRGQRGGFSSIRRAQTDYAVLNCGVAVANGSWRIVVGARPGRAMLVAAAAAHLEEHGVSRESADTAGELSAANLQFGDNPRASKTYRRAVCPALVARTILEAANAD